MDNPTTQHHHHSTISNYAFIHDHDPKEHNEEGRHTPRYNDDRIDYHGATPDDYVFGSAHYDHKPQTLTFNDPPFRRERKHRFYRWSHV